MSKPKKKKGKSKNNKQVDIRLVSYINLLVAVLQLIAIIAQLVLILQTN